MSKIADSILEAFPGLNEYQHEAIRLTEGPLLIIAGPGSGKTLALVLRTLNLLLQGLSEPDDILLCTFTEKAAFELRDRLSALARKLEYKGNLSSLNIGTIHGIANSFLMRYRHHTPLGNDYEILDELTQLLFIFDHFDEIVQVDESGKYFGRWGTRWTAIEGIRTYFNKITEELVDSARLRAAEDPFVRAIGSSYEIYVQKLFDTNRVDFAHQQKLFLNLLENPDISSQIKQRIRYVMVDEYQDTNYVQEQMLLHLADDNQNIAVVGDEDQALYRFRGGTVRNILEFPNHFKNCQTVTLSTNYRSHKNIIETYDKFMRSWDWTDSDGNLRFRYNKTIEADPEGVFPEYPAVFSIWGENKEDEAARFAELATFLKESRVIEDESQVALLLHSVRHEHSGPYLEALAKRGISTFCPRSRTYFENKEVRYMLACFAVLLGYYGEYRGEVTGRGLVELADYIDRCIVELSRNYCDPHPLAKCIQKYTEEIQSLKKDQTLNRHLADYFYRFLAHDPFAVFVQNENRARNLAIFSQLLNIFQTYYHYTVITAKNRESLRLHFFHSFLRLLYEGGINEYEDPNQPIPKGYVQVMTIHQSKGLEFPVIVVGSLSVQLSSPKEVERILGPFFNRPPFEPENRVTGFDRMRLHYVAFSRAEKILVLTAADQPKPHFNTIWQGLPQWPYVRQDLLNSLFFRLRHRMPVRQAFSFTSDLKVYETCPRQYEFFRYYQFTPARSAEYFFGSLVHQTIEDIHRWSMEGKGDQLNEHRILGLFRTNYQNLLSRGLRPIGPKQQEEALNQVLNYFGQNKSGFDKIVEIEVDVSVDKEDYILTGKVDLLLGSDDKLQLLDFKSQPRPEAHDIRVQAYYQQLCTYAHILETRDGKQADRLMLYWTGEPKREDALMTFVYEPNIVEAAGIHFDEVVKSILTRDFKIRKFPDHKVCKECDLRVLCRNSGNIQ